MKAFLQVKHTCGSSMFTKNRGSSCPFKIKIIHHPRASGQCQGDFFCLNFDYIYQHTAGEK